MNRKDYQQIKEIFQSAIELAPDERAAFLDKECRNDEKLLKIEPETFYRVYAVSSLNFSPSFDNLRDDPRYKVVVNRIGFPAVGS